MRHCNTYRAGHTHEDLVGSVLLAIVRAVDDGRATGAKFSADFHRARRDRLVQFAVRAECCDDAMLMGDAKDAFANLECR